MPDDNKAPEPKMECVALCDQPGKNIISVTCPKGWDPEENKDHDGFHCVISTEPDPNPTMHAKGSE